VSDEFITATLGNLGLDEHLEVAGADDRMIAWGTPGPRGFARATIPARYIADGFTVVAGTTPRGDDLRRGTPRSRPGPFTLTLQTFGELGDVPVSGVTHRVFPAVIAGMRAVHIVSDAEVTTWAFPPDGVPVTMRQLAMPGLIDAALLGPDAILLAGRFGLAVTSGTGACEPVAVEGAPHAPVVSVVRLGDRIVTLCWRGRVA
jgi:hypothetical protein